MSLNITASHKPQYLPGYFVMTRGSTPEHSGFLIFAERHKSISLSLILQRMFKKSKEISDDKVNIAVHTYELVDKHIRKLDSDLAKFESEMNVMLELPAGESVLTLDAKQILDNKHILAAEN